MAAITGQKTVNSWTALTAALAAAEGFPEVVSALQSGHSGAIDGAWGSSSALATAALGKRRHAILIVLAHAADLDGWCEDMASFTGVRPVVFPAWDRGPDQEARLDEVLGQRLRVLKLLERPEPPQFALTTIQAMMQPVPARDELARRRRVVRVGEETRPEEFVQWLVEHGLTRRETVELPGEFGRRGGILDVFPPDADVPYRLEFFGDIVESIRLFAAETQRSLDEVAEMEITALPDLQPVAGLLPSDGPLIDYLPADSWVALIEPGDVREQAQHYLERVPDPRGLFSVEGVFQQLLRLPSVTISAMPSASVETTCHLRIESVERFSGDMHKVRDELAAVVGKDTVLIACHNEGERKRLGELLSADGSSPSDPLALSPPHLLLGHVRAGFRLVELGIDVLGGHELFHREQTLVRRMPARRYEARAIDSFLDLAEGDLVVHVNHGIARYRGMQLLEKSTAGVDAKAGTAAEEHLTLEFAEGTKLYVPVSKIDLVQKYVGGAKTDPELSKLGGIAWQRRKERVLEAVIDLAGEMIDLQAVRAAQPGIAHPPDSEWQTEFEAAFPYEETPDQLTTLAEIKSDMERGRPMDRLICGDVGYGKTELAIRAAFKAIDNGKQVALLVPTTVLADQHLRTFSDRMAEFPFTVDCVSRFRTGKEQKEILNRLAAGGVDLIVGTHRLLSQDVRFKDLGLVIIDEEQRFGVEHKERLKKLRHTVDVLTLTATPIPRTLHLSLLGIRDISNLETPPRDRLAIETRITRFDPTLIRHAILRELNREGQVFFVHNRVQNIHAIAEQIKQIVPEARISVGHGQMAGDELEDVMLGFVRRESDLLVATTIIESGLDIPNANTIFINQADQYGLADMHQLRGRVGRYKHRAYCYLLVDPSRPLTPTAARRLKAIEEFTELGAGFKIAMRDLEIRGAGNILGHQQSGHIAAVGYELYCQLLETAVGRLKNQPLRTTIDVTLDLPWRAFLPRDYVAGQRPRIEVYRRLARIRKLERLADFGKELADRFGPLPEPVQWLLRSQELRIMAARWQIASIHLEKNDIVLAYRHRKRIERLAELSGKRLRVVDAESAFFRLRGRESQPAQLYETLKALLQSAAVTV